MSKNNLKYRIYQVTDVEWGDGDAPSPDDDGEEFPCSIYVNVPSAIGDPHKFVAAFLSDEVGITPINFRLKEESIH